MNFSAFRLICLNMPNLLFISSGKVLPGKKYGRKIGFPTANISRENLSRQEILPEEGIYAGFSRVSAKNEWLPSAIVFGPKDKKGLPELEVYILDFNEEIYGKELEVCFIKFLRPFKKFETEKDLIFQIKDDVLRTREVLEKFESKLPK